MSKFRETVNDLVGKLEKGEDGKWTMPEDIAKEVDEPTMHAIMAERRVRDTQSAFTQSRQELKRQQAIAEGLQEKLMKSEVALTQEQERELNTLKKSDPEKWRSKLNEYEEQNREMLKNELEDIRKKSSNKGELEVRQEQMAAWSESTGIKLTDEVVDNDLPPRYKKQLEAGEITFEEFLNKAGEFLQSEKVIEGADDSTEDDTKDLSRVAGGKEPSKSAQKGDLSETYEKTIF